MDTKDVNLVLIDKDLFRIRLSIFTEEVKLAKKHQGYSALIRLQERIVELQNILDNANTK